MSAEDWGIETADAYWFNTRTNQVEKGKLSPSTDRLGPFKTQSDAEQALAKLRDRAAQWEAEEAAEDEWGN